MQNQINKLILGQGQYYFGLINLSFCYLPRPDFEIYKESASIVV
jgi:hypothetical protein